MNQPDPHPVPPRSGRLTRFAVLVTVVALIAAAGAFLRESGKSRNAERQQEELGQLGRRIAILDDRIERERAELARLAQAIGATGSGEQTLAARLERLETAVDRLPGAPERLRLTWHIAQAEYYLRIATAQESLAGDAGAALTALELADASLRDASEPQLTAVRRLLAGEITAVRALPKVDREGIALRLDAVAGRLETLPRRQSALPGFHGQATPEPGTTTTPVARFMATLRDAFLRVVSVRRTQAPVTTLMSDEGLTLLLRSLQLELEMARMSLMRGETESFRASVRSVAGSLPRYFDTAAPAGAAALATLQELAAVPMPRNLPDLSRSLTELLRIKDRELKP